MSILEVVEAIEHCAVTQDRVSVLNLFYSVYVGGDGVSFLINSIPCPSCFAVGKPGLVLVAVQEGSSSRGSLGNMLACLSTSQTMGTSATLNTFRSSFSKDRDRVCLSTGLLSTSLPVFHWSNASVSYALRNDRSTPHNLV